MEIGKNLQDISNDAREYIKRSIDGYRLQFAENMSTLMGEVACRSVMFMLLFIAFLFMLVALVLVLALYIGHVLASLVAALFLTAVSILLYLFRERLFTDWFVKRIMKTFFEDCEEKE